jgi:hypothetical protein
MSAAPITWDSTMGTDSPQASRLAHECTCDAEQLCDEMLRHAAVLHRGSSDEANCASVLRMYALRLKELNSLLMSYLSDDSVTLRDAHHVVHGTWPAEGTAP